MTGSTDTVIGGASPGTAADGTAPTARRAVRRLTSGISVLTVDHSGDRHGTTVSAVTAVSRDPLLVSACLRHGSQFATLAVASGRFVVNVLSSAQALLADWFANPNRPAGRRQFDYVDVLPGVSGAPVLRDSLAWLACELVGHSPAGDHEILLAEVTGGQVGNGSPLVSFDSELHAVDLRDVRRCWRDPAQASTTTID